MGFPLPREVRWIIEEYEKHGHCAHVVGGPVRDYLLGAVPHDYDLTTDATPDETKEIFSRFRIIETGIRHGTLTLLLSDTPYEITTYRIDGEYLDNRHPEQVTFTRSLAEDLSRRDFTVNAMAYSPRDGIVDLFSGKEDLENKILRTVGVPQARFHEDALRILRALRFASVLGFAIEEGTARAIHECAHLMKNLAVERICEELIKLLSGKYALEVIREFSDTLAVVLPELAPALASASRIPRFTDGFTRTEEFAARLGYLASLCELGSHAYLSMCERLHTSREVRELGTEVLLHISDDTASDYALLSLLRSTSATAARLILAINAPLSEAHREARTRLEHLLAQEQPYRISQLAIGGAELMRLGISGKEIGQTLSELLDSVMRGELENEREVLFSYLKDKLSP